MFNCLPFWKCHWPRKVVTWEYCRIFSPFQIGIWIENTCWVIENCKGGFSVSNNCLIHTEVWNFDVFNTQVLFFLSVKIDLWFFWISIEFQIWKITSNDTYKLGLRIFLVFFVTFIFPPTNKTKQILDCCHIIIGAIFFSQLVDQYSEKKQPKEFIFEHRSIILIARRKLLFGALAVVFIRQFNIYIKRYRRNRETHFHS